MFFTTELLSKRDSGIGLLWMAATLGKTSIGKLSRRNVLKADIGKLCELVAEPTEPLALRLSSNLLVGVVRVYKVKHDIFLSEITTCFTSLKRTLIEISAAEASAALNMSVGSARPDTITLAAPEGGIGMNLDVDFGGPIWEDFFVPPANHPPSSSPGITSQDFCGTESQTHSQRPLYTLDESHVDLFMGAEAADPIGLGLGLEFEEFDLGLGQDAFGDPVLFEDTNDIQMNSPGKRRQKVKSKVGAAPEAGEGPIDAQESSVPVDPLNLDDWAIGLEPSSSGLDLPESGGQDVFPSRPGSRFQSREPQAVDGDVQLPFDVFTAMGEGGGVVSIPATSNPKKPKKAKGVIQDKRTELGEDELGLDGYLKGQKRLRIEVELRRQERDAARVIDIWMEGVPNGLHCPALEGWFKQSFKTLVGETSNRRKRDEDDGFAAPALPAKRRREDTPSQAAEMGRNIGTPMDFGDDQNWGGNNMNFGADFGIHRGSSVEVAEHGMRGSRPVSQARDQGDINISQRSSLLPWDNVGLSSSTNGETGLVGAPGDDIKVDHVTVKLRGSSRSRRDSSLAPSRLSASPGRFGPGLDTFGGDEFEFPATADERPSQLEVTMERNSFKFLEYVRMQEQALVNPSGGVMFSALAPVESSTSHVAAAAFYHTLMLATKSAVRVRQVEPFADFSIQTLLRQLM